MALTVTIPDRMARTAAELARASGTTPEAVILEALQVQLLPDSPDLQAEFDAWDLASDEDMIRLELEG
jgi:hypothetical protein